MSITNRIIGAVANAIAPPHRITVEEAGAALEAAEQREQAARRAHDEHRKRIDASPSLAAAQEMAFDALRLELAQGEACEATDQARAALVEAERLVLLEAGDPDTRLSDVGLVVADLSELLGHADAAQAEITKLEQSVLENVADRAERLAKLRAEKTAAERAALARVDAARAAVTRKREAWVAGGRVGPKCRAFPHVPGDLNAPSRDPRKWLAGLRAELTPARPLAGHLDRLRQTVADIMVSRERQREINERLAAREKQLRAHDRQAYEQQQKRLLEEAEQQAAETRAAQKERDRLLEQARQRERAIELGRKELQRIADEQKRREAAAELDAQAHGPAAPDGTPTSITNEHGTHDPRVKHAGGGKL